MRPASTQTNSAPATAPASPASVVLRVRGNQIDEMLHIPVGATRILGSVRGEADFRIRDPQISRLHAELSAVTDSELNVRRLPNALNRIYLLGADHQFHDQHYDAFQVGSGQTFAIGTTYFTVEPVTLSGATANDPQPAMSVSLSANELRQELLANTGTLLQGVLELPTALARATSDEATQREALRVLLANLPAADLAAIVRIEADRVCLVQHTGHLEIHLSRSLVAEALQTGQAVLYHWLPNDPHASGMSLVQQPTWAACFRLGYSDLCLYTAGRITQFGASLSEIRESPRWRSVLRFLELVGSLLGSVLTSRGQRRFAERLLAFLPNQIRQRFENLSDPEWQEILRPRLCDLTVMFCDLVGFARLAQQQAHNTGPFWETVRRALSIMTQCIHLQEGVVIDFQGDSVLAIWGWPEQTISRENCARQAARAALNILERFGEVQQCFDDLTAQAALPGERQVLRCGVALTSGEGLIGFLGNQELGGIDVFGHTVNRSARIQGLTRRFHTPILIDEPTADLLCHDPPGWCRVDPLLCVSLAGMEGCPGWVAQLTSTDEATTPPTREERQLFESGHWDRLWERLLAAPPESGFRLFLRDFLVENGRRAPAGWDGVYAQKKGG